MNRNKFFAWANPFKLETNPTYEKPIIISACYRPPNSNATYNDNLAKEISNICKKYKTQFGWEATLISQTLIGTLPVFLALRTQKI